MVEFNRQSLALLQKIKRLAKEEQGYSVHYDSATLEDDLRALIGSGVSEELLDLVKEFLPTMEPSGKVEEGKMYRGTNNVVDNRPRVGPSTRIYRGQIVTD